MLLSSLFLIGAAARYIDKKPYEYGPDYYAPLIEDFFKSSARADSFGQLAVPSTQAILEKPGLLETESGIRPLSRSAAVENVGQINLNTASTEELQSLPGIGPALAGRILTLRKRMREFAHKEDLRMVPGIGEKTLDRIKAHIYILTDSLKD